MSTSWLRRVAEPTQTRAVRNPFFPIPLRYIVPPALLLAAFTTFYVIAVPEGWAFISLPHVSGLPRASVQISGPFVAGAVAAITSALTDPAHPSSSAVAKNFSRVLTLRIVVTLIATLGLSALVAGLIAALAIAPGADGGALDVLELLTAPIQLTWIISLSVLIGRLAPGWTAPVLAIVVTASYIWVLPVVASIILPATPHSVGYEFLFPGTPAWQHEPFSLGPYGIVIIWWLAATVSVVLLSLWYSETAQDERRSSRSFALGSCVVTVALLALVVAGRMPFFQELAAEEPICREASEIEVCVSQEEVSQEQQVRAAVIAAMDRLDLSATGSAPVEVWSVQARLRAPDHVVADGTFVVPITSTDGAAGVFDEVAGRLSGLDQCGVSGSPAGLEWSLTLTMWIQGQITPEISAADPVTLALRDATQAEVIAWYADNREALSVCQYDGDGP